MQQQQQHFWVWFGCLKTVCPELQFHFPEANDNLRLSHDDFAGLAALMSRLSSTKPEHKQIVLFGTYQMQAITRIFLGNWGYSWGCSQCLHTHEIRRVKLLVVMVLQIAMERCIQHS
jgi:hypothetical protein